MAVCPFAERKLIAPGGNDPRINARVAILHVDAGNAFSLFNFFRYRSGGIESHFHIRKDGVIEQYRDTNWQADANYRANDFGISIETQGWGGGRWNAKQLASIKRLLVWLNKAEGIPLRKCDGPYGSGVGYHVQFGSPGPWTPVAKSCPGPRRIKQYHDDLVPWMNGDPRKAEPKEWDEMATKKEVEDAAYRGTKRYWDEEVPARTTSGKKTKVPRWKLIQRGHNVVVEGHSDDWGRD